MIIAANCYIGEFGWELFCWQGFLRAMARDGHDVVVSCIKGQELLYGDFAKAISSFELVVNDRSQQDDANMWMNAPHTLRHVGLQGEWPDKIDRTIRASTYRTRWWLEDPMPQQAFVSYYQSPVHGCGYDVLLHIRDRHMTAYKTEFRNWPIEHAQKVTDILLERGLHVACIGKSFSSLCTKGADDRRDIDLYGLRAVMSHSRVLIGPQSGPTHFAVLCELPQVSWQSKEEHAERVRKHWNPLNVATRTNAAAGDSYWRKYKLWLPEANWIVNAALELMEGA